MWSGASALTAPNWKGNTQFSGDEELYLVPTVSNTTDTNYLGIVDGNVIALPTSYPELTTENLNTTTINGNPVPISAENWSLYPAIHDVIADQQNAPAYTPYTLYLAGAVASVGDNDYTCLLAGETLAPPSLLDAWNPAFEYVVNVGYGATYLGVFYIATQTNTNVIPPTSLGVNWRLAEWDNTYSYSTGDLVFVTSTGLWYKANGANTNVSPLDPPPAPPLPAVWTQIQFWTTADYVNPIWNIKGFDDIQSASVTTLVADADQLTVASKTTLGDGADALTVNGGTVLDGGLLHGTTIGCLPVAEVNTIRLDVLPVGIDLTSATYIAGVAAGAVSWNAGGAANIAAGGAVSIAGGDYIEYNTDQNFFRNTSAGNDYTDIYVGNIHPADAGTANLRINAEGSLTRGVEISDGTDWTTQNITVTNEAVVNKLLALDATAFDFTSLSYVKIPESQNLPTNWNGVVNYDLWDYVIYAPTSTYYFSIVADNLNNNPSTTSGYWLLANWDVATTYLIDYPTFEPTTQSFWISLLNGNTGNFPLIPAVWDYTTTYAIDELVLYGELHYKSLENSNTGHYPDEPTPLEWDSGTTYVTNDLVTYLGLRYQSLQSSNVGNDPSVVGSVWWVQVPIWWENVPIWWSPTTKYHLGNTDTGVVFTPIVSGSTGITTLVKRVGDPNEELNVIVKNPTGVELSAQSVVTSPMYKDFDMNGHNITNLGTITIGDLDVGGNLTVAGTTILSSDLTANGAVTVTGTTTFNSDLTANGTTTFNSDLTANGAVNLHDIYDSTGGDIQVHSALDLNANSIVNVAGLIVDTVFCNTLKSPGTAPVHAPFGLDQLVSISNGSSDITVSSRFDMSGFGIIRCPSIVSTGGFGLTAQTGNIVLSASSSLILDAVGGYCEIHANGYTDIATGGALTLNSTTSTATLSANNDVGLTSATSYISLTAGTGQDIIAHNRLDMTSKNIVNCPQITGTGNITVASGGTNTNVVLTPNGTGLIVANKDLNMNSNAITNCRALTSDVDLSLDTGTGGVITLNGHNLTYAPAILNPGGIGLAASGGDISLAPGISASNTNFIQMYNTLNLNSNLVTGVAKINGHNIYQYGRFYNSATQTLGASGTATRVVMNSGTGLGVSLDTTTNIGRISFAKDGTYLIEWNGYFVHGGGSATTSTIWIRLNGSSNVAGTGKTQRCDTGLNDISIGSSAQVTVTTSDYLEFVWAANGTNVPLTAIAASSPYPAIPSFSCSISIIA